MATSNIYTRTFDEDVPTKTNTTPSCPECDGIVRTNTVETTCEDCGLITDEQPIDHGPEWHAYDEAECERTGAPLTTARHDRGLSTEIGRNVDATGSDLSGRKRRQLGRLRREHRRGKFRSTAEQNLAHGLGEVRRIAGALGLAKTIRDQACQLFRSAQSERLFPGRSIEAMAAASVYGACRCNGCSRTLDDVVGPSRVGEASVRSAYKTLNRELGLPTKPMTPSAFVPRLASALDVANEVQQQARTLAERVESAGVLTGASPSGVAAACLYEALCDQERDVTQTAAAEAANVTAVTVRTHWKTLQKVAD